MITLEQVEKLREKANISYDDAKAALEATNGDLLEALINLEKQGKVTPPEGGGYYSSEKCFKNNKEQTEDNKGKTYNNKESLSDLVRKLARFCGKIIHKGNINSFEVLKDGEVKIGCPITILVLLVVCFFWITVPLIIIGLFFGYRYRFRGPDLGKESVNNAMDSAANAAESIKKSISAVEKE